MCKDKIDATCDAHMNQVVANMQRKDIMRKNNCANVLVMCEM